MRHVWKRSDSLCWSLKFFRDLTTLNLTGIISTTGFPEGLNRGPQQLAVWHYLFKMKLGDTTVESCLLGAQWHWERCVGRTCYLFKMMLELGICYLCQYYFGYLDRYSAPVRAGQLPLSLFSLLHEVGQCQSPVSVEICAAASGGGFTRSMVCPSRSFRTACFRIHLQGGTNTGQECSQALTILYWQYDIIFDLQKFKAEDGLEELSLSDFHISLIRSENV